MAGQAKRDPATQCARVCAREERICIAQETVLRFLPRYRAAAEWPGQDPMQARRVE